MKGLAIALGLAGATLVVGCTHHGRADSSSGLAQPLRSVGGMQTGFGLNGSKIAWVGTRVVVADLDPGHRVDIVGGGGNAPAPVAVSGSTVLWLDNEGGLSQKNTVFTASPARRARRVARWLPETEAPLGTFFGGVAGEGRLLVLGLYKLSGNAEACYEGACRRRVSGGGTLLVTPGSLAVHRVLPPSKAVAASNGSIAAAVFRLQGAYTGKAQVVVENLSNGTRRSIGRRASVLALGLDRVHVAALIGSENGSPAILRVWNVATGRLARSFHVPAVERVVVIAGPHAVLRLGGSIFSLNLRNGRRQLISRRSSYGPWVSRGRVWWVETYDQGLPKARSLVRSAPLPGPLG
jgi:hypothetical protein